MHNHFHQLFTKVIPLTLRTKIRQGFSTGQSTLTENNINYESALPEGRHEYKSTWNVLSQTFRQAIIHVIGDVGENEIQATAVATRNILETATRISSSDIVLEIGCGIGRVGQVIAPLCKEWIGCDVSVNMLNHAQKRLELFKNIKLIEISGFDLAPIPDTSVDLVYCTVVFMHLDEWDRYNYVLEAFRVLRPGGRIYVDNFNLCSKDGWEIFDLHRRSFPRYRPPHIGKSSTPQEIEVYLARAGFQTVKIVERGAWVHGSGIK